MSAGRVRRSPPQYFTEDALIALPVSPRAGAETGAFAGTVGAAAREPVRAGTASGHVSWRGGGVAVAWTIRPLRP